jgi:hypothetical protein
MAGVDCHFRRPHQVCNNVISSNSRGGIQRHQIGKMGNQRSGRRVKDTVSAVTTTPGNSKRICQAQQTQSANAGHPGSVLDLSKKYAAPRSQTTAGRARLFRFRALTFSRAGVATAASVIERTDYTTIFSIRRRLMTAILRRGADRNLAALGIARVIVDPNTLTPPDGMVGRRPDRMPCSWGETRRSFTTFRNGCTSKSRLTLI